jgi:hypothetical protein
MPNAAFCVDRNHAGYDFETDPEAGHDFETFNCQLISTGSQSVSYVKVEHSSLGRGLSNSSRNV